MIPQSSPRQTHGNCVSPSPSLPPSGVDDGREEAPGRGVLLTPHALCGPDEAEEWRLDCRTLSHLFGRNHARRAKP